MSIKHQRGEEEVPLLIQVLSAVLSLDEVGLPRRLTTAPYYWLTEYRTLRAPLEPVGLVH